jgi:hypothetical protein
MDQTASPSNIQPITSQTEGIELVTPTTTPSNNGWREKWQHKRWLLIAIGSSIAIVALIIALLITLSINHNTQAGDNTSKPQPTGQQTEAPTTHNSADDQFFRNQPLTLLYYSFSQTNNSKNIYQATPKDYETRTIDIGFPDKFSFSTSPNGAWLIRWNGQIIEKSAAAQPSNISPLFKMDDSKERIESVIWQNDSSALAISTTKIIDSNNPENFETNIYIVPLLTMQPVAIHNSTTNFAYELVAYPSSTQLYMQEKHRNKVQNLTLYNPQSKQIERQHSSLNDSLSQLTFSRDMQWGFKSTDTEVVRYELSTLGQSVVYRVDRSCQVGPPNSSTLAGASISPSGDLLLVHEQRAACQREQRSRSTTPTPVPPTSRTLVFSISQNKAMQQTTNLPLTHIQDGLWSPNEEIIWITADAQHSYTLHHNSMELTPIPTTERQNLTRERVFPIGWLAPQ